MIPATLFERLTSTFGLKDSRALSERRDKLRVPCSIRTIAFPVFGDRTEAPIPVRVKDISVGGIGILYTSPNTLSNEFVIRYPVSELETVYMLCTMRRLSKFDGVCSVAGCSFEKVLSFGQRIETGTVLSMVVWEEVNE